MLLQKKSNAIRKEHELIKKDREERMQAILTREPLPDILGRHLYMGELAERLIRTIKRRITYSKERYQRDKALNLKNIAKMSGINLQRLYKIMDFQAEMRFSDFDKLLLAIDLSLLDLLTLNEIASRYGRFDSKQRYGVRRKHIDLLRNLNEKDLNPIDIGRD